MSNGERCESRTRGSDAATGTGKERQRQTKQGGVLELAVARRRAAVRSAVVDDGARARRGRE